MNKVSRLDMEVEDGNKLNELFNKWYGEDNPPKIPNTIMDKIVDFLNELMNKM
jgi:hypothetical protein